MALMEDDDPVEALSLTGGPLLHVWSRSDGTSTIELDLTDAEAQIVLPAIQGYFRQLTQTSMGLS